jgi:hypothetical protein
MARLTWHAGSPPTPGWWPASGGVDPRILRHHDGHGWSAPVTDTDTDRLRELVQRGPHAPNPTVRWRWPTPRAAA